MREISNAVFDASEEEADLGKILFVQLKEDLKMENSPIFREYFEVLYRQDATQHIVMDFSQIRFIDSTGLGMLIQYARELKEKRGAFYVTGLNQSLRAVFRLAGLYKVFQITDPESLLNAFPFLSSSIQNTLPGIQAQSQAL